MLFCLLDHLIINSKGFIYIQDFAFYSKSNFDICSVTDSMKQKFLIFLANITYEIGTNCFLVLLGNNWSYQFLSCFGVC